MEQDPIPQQFNSLPDNSSEIPMGAFEAGDIVLPASGSPKKGRKGLVFLILVFVLVLGGGGYLYFSSSFRYSGDIRESFNKYANFLLYGKESTEDMNAEYSFTEDYYVIQQINDRDHFADFISKSNSLRDAVNKHIETLESNKNNDIIVQWNILIKKSQFVEVYYAKDFLGYSSIESYYVENGAEKTKEFVVNYYTNNYKENDYLNSLIDYNTQRGNAVVERLEIFNSLGCISKVEDLACFEQRANDEQKASADALYATFRENNVEYLKYESFYDDFIASIFVLNDILNGGENE